MKSHSTGRQEKSKSERALAYAAVAPDDVRSHEQRAGRWRLAAPAIAGVVASVLLLWGLGEQYLWQDEANTAVLATRILRFGRPLAYDGVNLLTIDHFDGSDVANIEKRAADPKATVSFYVDHGAYKRDTAWTFHPWAQFFVAAASLKILGQTTLAARLPFALAALATILLLYRLVRVYCRSDSMALIAAALLICNSYWILHSRQCRYYPLSSLFLVLTLTAYIRWQSGARWGATTFVACAWAWFQVDYGTVWPVFGVLSLDALWANRKNPWRTLCAGVALGAMIAPFTVFYHLTGRASVQGGGSSQGPNYRYWFNILNMNEYVVPLLVVAAAAALLAWRWKTISAAERRLVAIASGIICGLTAWVPTITSDIFLRYIIMAAPAGSLLSAWLLVRGCNGRTAYAWVGAAVLILTPWLRIPLHFMDPPTTWYPNNQAAINWMYKGELATLLTEVFNPPPDPNRIVIEWLRQNTQPSDEILINYEDTPLMFYLPNPIRGGLEAFRAEDDAKKPPDVLVIRRSVAFVHWNIFAREINRYRWSVAPVGAPDVVWGNNPDPMAKVQDPAAANKIIVARRTENGTSRGVVFGNARE